MNNFIKKFINYETVSYLIAGILTTLVDYVVFIAVNEWLKAHGGGILGGLISPALTATAVSWIVAVLFAYVVNKLVVFKSFRIDPSVMLREAAGFFAARATSGIIVMIFMWIVVDKLGCNEYLAKIASSAFNMVFNYVASKFFIFKK